MHSLGEVGVGPPAGDGEVSEPDDEGVSALGHGARLVARSHLLLTALSRQLCTHIINPFLPGV